MNKQPSRRSDGAMDRETFQQMRQDADELLWAARRAAEMFYTRPAESFGQLSDLIDEVLPVDPAAEARIARAVEMEPQALARIRARQLDPAGAPEFWVPLASLGKTLGLSRETFLRLAGRDHARFGGGMGLLRSTRGDAASDALDGLRAAWERVELDDPSLFGE